MKSIRSNNAYPVALAAYDAALLAFDKAPGKGPKEIVARESYLSAQESLDAVIDAHCAAEIASATDPQETGEKTETPAGKRKAFFLDPGNLPYIGQDRFFQEALGSYELALCGGNVRAMDLDEHTPEGAALIAARHVSTDAVSAVAQAFALRLVGIALAKMKVL